MLTPALYLKAGIGILACLLLYMAYTFAYNNGKRACQLETVAQIAKQAEKNRELTKQWRDDLNSWGDEFIAKQAKTIEKETVHTERVINGANTLRIERPDCRIDDAMLEDRNAVRNNEGLSQ